MAKALKVGESAVWPETIFSSAPASSVESRSGTSKPASSAWLTHQAVWMVTKSLASVPPAQ